MYSIRKDVEDEMKSLSDVVRNGRRVRDISDVGLSAFVVVILKDGKTSTSSRWKILTRFLAFKNTSCELNDEESFAPFLHCRSEIVKMR